jgi:glycosyltransferase involved in cell wall biosynthesis
VVAPANPVALREALAALIADPDARRRMGEAGRSRAHALYSARRMGDDLKRAYSQVLAYA